MTGGRLPKRIVLRNLEGAVRRGRGGKEKEWTDCVQSDIRAFGIARDSKAMSLKAEVWVDTVAEGSRRFMAAWRREEVDAPQTSPEEESRNETGKVVIAHGSVECCIGLADESKESLYGRETAARGGGGGCAARRFRFYPFFPVQQTTSGIGHNVRK